MKKRVWQNPLLLHFAHQFGCEGDPVGAIEKARDSLLERSDEFEDRSTVVNVDLLADLLGLRHSTYEYREFSGTGQTTLRRDGQLAIQLNPKRNLSLYRYRYTIAHEIAHILIRRNTSETLSGEERRLAGRFQKEEELLCQFAAASILMPDDRIARYLSERPLSLHLIHAMSRDFRVSLQVVINRLAYLLDNAYAVYWKFSSKPGVPSNKRLRVAWVYPNTLLKVKSFIPYHASARDDRFTPNILADCYNNGVSGSARVYVRRFGQLDGRFQIHSINPNERDLFHETNYRRNADASSFDLITLFEEEKASIRKKSSSRAADQLDLFRVEEIKATSF